MLLDYPSLGGPPATIFSGTLPSEFPQGKLPFALASNAAAIVAQAPGAPGYPAADTLFPLGFGPTY